MPDKLYEVTGVEQAYWAVAARYAVFRPILGVSDVGDDLVPDHLERLRKQWWARIASLHEACWEPARDTGNFLAMRRCPPFGVSTTRQSRPCNRHRICPFCYARRNVINPFFNLVWACYGTYDSYREVDGKRVAYEPIDRTLIEFSYLAEYPRPGTKLRVVLEEIQRTRQDEVNQLVCDGAYVNHTVESFPDRVWVRRRGVILCPHDQGIAETDDTQVRVHRRISRRLLAETLGRVCRYPARLMRSHAAEVEVFLRRAEGIALAQHYGALRNRRARLGDPRVRRI